MNSIEILQEKLNYKFKDIELLKQSLTHSSYANENDCKNYERLEFLGDAVIELVVSNYIYNHFDISSGELSKLRAKLVSTENLNDISLKLDLKEYVLKSLSLSQLSKKTNADLFESVLGAVYLDGGLDCASAIIEKFVIVDCANVESVLNRLDDAKSSLQELLQKQNQTWEYKTIDAVGLDHNKTFIVALYVDGEKVVEAEGKSLHIAQNECAKNYLLKINKNEKDNK